MNRKISDNEFRESLDRRLSPLQPDPWMAQKIRNRARQKEGEPVKKRLSVGTVLVLVILLLSVSVGIATVSGWDVMQFLYGTRTAQRIPEVEVFPVHREAVAGGALFRVESAIYDGKKLVFDLYMENQEPDQPIEARLDQFTVNGISVKEQIVESAVSNVWVPNLYIYDTRNYLQGGEIIDLPEELKGLETLRISMKFLVYRPVIPVFWMREPDAEEFIRKKEEGYLVISDPYDYLEYDPDDGEWYAVGVAEHPECFRIEPLEITFDVSKGSEVDRVLQPQPVYETTHGTASYDVAAANDSGLHLTLRLNPENDAFSRIRDFVLTDGDGTPLEGDRFVPDVHMQVNTGGEDHALVFRYRWSQARLKDLPDAISLTCILEDGEKLVFPVKVR